MNEFNLIKKEFKKFDQELYDNFRFVVRETEKGIWGTSDLDAVFELFKKIKLSGKFVDLGCGDGRVVLAASLFSDAVGVEVDEDLVRHGEKVREKLGLKAELVCGDFFDCDVSKYDVIFINPDTGFYNGLEDKLLEEMKGRLFVYNDVFLPRFLNKVKVYRVGGMVITEFRKE